MSPVAPAGLVIGATRQPLPYGLFSVVTLRPQGVDRWETGVEWEPATCGPAGGIGLPDCDPLTPTLGLPKDLDPNSDDTGTATPFTVYGHFTCSPVGYSVARAQDLATEHLLAAEEARVEQAFWTGDLGNVPSLRGATVLGAGAAVPLAVGLALLEDFIADSYTSLGVIHLTRGSALQAAADDLVTRTASRLSTVIGTPVVAGAGYDGSGPAGQASADGQVWAYVTPALFGYRSDVFTSSARPGDLFDRATNSLTAVAERSYLLGFDPCGVGAALLDLGGTS